MFNVKIKESWETLPYIIRVSILMWVVLFFNLFIYRIILALTPSINYPILPFSDWPAAFLVGARFDLSAGSMGALLAFLFSIIVPWKWQKKSYPYFFFILVIFYLLVIITDWFFYRWISFRIDSRIFPFFTDPDLMSGGAADTPISVPVILAFFLFFGLINYFIWKKIKYQFIQKRTNKIFKSYIGLIFASFIVLLYLFVAICSLRGFDTIPLKARDYTFHGRDQVNLVSRSPFFQFASELMLYIKLSQGSKFNGILPEEAVKRLRTYMKFSPQSPSKNPLEHELHKCFRKTYGEHKSFPKKPNIVFFQIESLGTNKIKKLRFLNKLIAKSFYFDSFFATGTVTFDGLWSSLCSVEPTYGRLQTALLSNNFQCIPDIVKSLSYNNVFFYAGDPDMDGMRSFANRHNFDEIYEKRSFPPEKQKLKLYLDDEVLFQKVFLQMKKTQEPFFYYILNSQTHPPEEFPEGFVWPEGLEDHSVFTYFDLSLEKFFKQVEKEKFYENTIFIIAADHTQHNQSYNPTDDTSIGSTLWEFRIPLIIFSPAFKKIPEKAISYFASQVDIPPTLYDILDLDINIKGWGQSVFCKNEIKTPVPMFSRRLSYLTVIDEPYIYSSGYKHFDNNRILAYDENDIYNKPLKDITKEGEAARVRDILEFYYQANRNIIANSYYWK